jgi:hypothetical protein
MASMAGLAARAIRVRSLARESTRSPVMADVNAREFTRSPVMADAWLELKWLRRGHQSSLVAPSRRHCVMSIHIR